MHLMTCVRYARVDCMRFVSLATTLSNGPPRLPSGRSCVLYCSWPSEVRESKTCDRARGCEACLNGIESKLNDPMGTESSSSTLTSPDLVYTMSASTEPETSVFLTSNTPSVVACVANLAPSGPARKPCDGIALILGNSFVVSSVVIARGRSANCAGDFEFSSSSSSSFKPSAHLSVFNSRCSANALASAFDGGISCFSHPNPATPTAPSSSSSGPHPGSRSIFHSSPPAPPVTLPSPTNFPLPPSCTPQLPSLQPTARSDPSGFHSTALTETSSGSLHFTVKATWPFRR